MLKPHFAELLPPQAETMGVTKAVAALMEDDLVEAKHGVAKCVKDFTCTGGKILRAHSTHDCECTTGGPDGDSYKIAGCTIPAAKFKEHFVYKPDSLGGSVKLAADAVPLDK